MATAKKNSVQSAKSKVNSDRVTPKVKAVKARMPHDRLVKPKVKVKPHTSPLNNPQDHADHGKDEITRYSPEIARQAEHLCRLGATEWDLMRFWNVSHSTLWRWRHANPEFAKALGIGREDADKLVELALYHRALGYKHQAEKIMLGPGGQVIKVEYTEHYPPDLGSMIFWLKNRKPEVWRDKRVDKDGEDADAAIKLLKHVASKLPD